MKVKRRRESKPLATAFSHCNHPPHPEIKVPEISSFHSPNDLWNDSRNFGHPILLSYCRLRLYLLPGSVIMHSLIFSKMSSQFVYANAFLLLNIVFLPFPTAILRSMLYLPIPNPQLYKYFMLFCDGHC
jgi:hypothetical protein